MSCRAHLPKGMRVARTRDNHITLGFPEAPPLAGGVGGAVALCRRPRRANASCMKVLLALPASVSNACDHNPWGVSLAWGSHMLRRGTFPQDVVTLDRYICPHFIVGDHQDRPDDSMSCIAAIADVVVPFDVDNDLDKVLGDVMKHHSSLVIRHPAFYSGSTPSARSCSANRSARRCACAACCCACAACSTNSR
jgi:hypothetical protein